MKKTKLFSFIGCVIFLVSCKSVDLAPETIVETITEDQELKEQEELKQEVLIEEIAAIVDMEKQVVYVEKPIYQPAKENIKEINASEAVIDNIIFPANYNGSAMIYDYQEDFVYEVYTKVLRTTDIYLEPGEKLNGDPILSDTVRFIWDIGINRDARGIERQHIYIKPTTPGLEATLIINTNLRTYHMILFSYSTDTYMPIIRWKYPQTAHEKLSRLTVTQNSAIEVGIHTDTITSEIPDFNFTMSYGVFRKPEWLPELVYAFEGKTYIQIPKEAFQRELPGVFGDKNELINYRLSGNTFIIDKLLDKITLKLENKKVTIRRKK